MDKFTLKQFRYFAALAREKHFGRAALSCAITQPALSVQIRDLELTLGTALFERSARNLRLTAFGESFLDRVKHILRAVDDLDDFARAAQDPLAGRFRMGVIPTIAPYLLPDLVGCLSETCPDLDLHVRETLTERLVHELLEGKLDAALVALPVDEPTLVETPLFFERFLLVRPQSDADTPLPDITELRDNRLLLLEEGHCLRDQAMSFCGPRSASAREGLDGSSLSTLVQMVGAGMGVTLIPEMAQTVETRLGRVVCAPFADAGMGRMVGMIWRRSSPLATAFEQIADVVRQVGQSLRSAEPH
jgi:LysR family hydrogen peroxide-inducible transcriptional activator